MTDDTTPTPPTQPAAAGWTPPAGAVPPPAGSVPAPPAPPAAPDASRAGAYPPPAAPVYGAPAYTAPQYPQSAYGQPGYGQPSAPYGQPAPGYGYAPPRPTNVLAIVSLIASIAGLSLLPFIGSIAGVITGHMSLKALKTSGENGRGLALAGTIVGWVGAGIWLLVIGIWLISLLFIIGVANSTYPYA